MLGMATHISPAAHALIKFHKMASLGDRGQEEASQVRRWDGAGLSVWATTRCGVVSLCAGLAALIKRHCRTGNGRESAGNAIGRDRVEGGLELEEGCYPRRHPDHEVHPAEREGEVRTAGRGEPAACWLGAGDQVTHHIRHHS